MNKKTLKAYAVLLLIIWIAPCNAGRAIKENPSNNQSLSKIERDIDICEIGEIYYEKCELSFFSSDSFDTEYYPNDDYKNDWKYAEIWANNPIPVTECTNGEMEVSIGWLNKEHKGYIRSEDIKDCMNDKGYVRDSGEWVKRKKGYIKDSGKWIESKSGFIYFKNQWISPAKYINLHTGIKNELVPAPVIPLWETRIYPRSKCILKYLPNKSKDYRCDESGEYYQGKGEYIGSFFYPNVIVRELSKANFSIEDIREHLVNGDSTIQKPKDILKPSKDYLVVDEIPKNTPENISKPNINNFNGYIGELIKIKDLLDSGVINQDEFELMKKKVIDKL